MGMPSDVGIVDCMIGFPAQDFAQYDFIRKQLKDGSTDFDFPVEYMFKQVPKELYGRFFTTPGTCPTGVLLSSVTQGSLSLPGSSIPAMKIPFSAT